MSTELENGLRYYVLDIETLGTKTGYHEINQISILRVATEDQITINIAPAHPERASKEALEIQGITPEDLLVGCTLSDAISQVNDYFAKDGKTPAHRCIIAHNGSFDRKFVHYDWEAAGLGFPADNWICTMAFAKRYAELNDGQKIAQAQINAMIDGIKADKKTGRLKPKFGLNNFMTGVGLPLINGAHQAGVDVRNTLVLYRFLMESKTEYLSLIERHPHNKKTEELDIDDF